MDILVVGLNHRTAPLAVRERLHVPDNLLPDALRRLLELDGVEEGAILSTCNRVEIYVRGKRPQERAMRRFLGELQEVPPDLYLPYLYLHDRDDAVRHLFRVTASLDSLIVGEPQIVGQVKEAFAVAFEAGTAGPTLRALLDRALRVAKRVRNDTAVAESAVSIAYAAVELARRIFGDLAGRRVLLVGAAEMADLAARHLVSHGAGEVLVTNRSYDRAVELARRYRGSAVPFQHLADHLADVDVVVTSTGAPRPVILREHVAEAMRKRRHRPLFFMDIAVPRDVDPAVHRLDNVYLYDIDNLQQVVEENLAARREEAARAETIVEKEVRDYQIWLRRREVAPTIQALRERADQHREAELDRIGRVLESADPEVRDAVEEATRRLVNKILHEPLRGIRRTAAESDGMSRLQRIRDLFGLDED